MVKRIDEITEEQRATFPGWVEKWVAVGWRTGTLDETEWETVRNAVRACYGFADLKQPKVILDVRSPMQAALASSIGKTLAETDGLTVPAGLTWEQLTEGVTQPWASRGEDVQGGIWAGITASGLPEGDTDIDTFRTALVKGIGEAPREWHQQCMGGNLWCSWEAWATWLVEVGGLELEPDLQARLNARVDLTLAGYSHWYEDFCVVTDRPVALHVETIGGRSQMHNETGPAIAWADGFKLYFWHGTRVPADLIEEGWDTTRILQEENSEVRRCAIERMGWDRFIEEAGLKQVGESMPDPGNPGYDISLWDVPERIYGDADVRVLLCTNATEERDGSRRRFGLTVPASVQTPLEAAAWTFDETPEEYAQLARAT